MAKAQSDAKGIWPFALGVYTQPGIAPHFLAFQEDFGADVNLLLYACWEGAERGRRLSGDEIGTAAARVADWHVEVVRALRALRTRMKAGFPSIDPVGGERLREQIKALEIGAERLELEALEAAALSRPPDGDPDAGLAAVNLRACLEHFAGHAPRPQDEERLRHVVDAVAKLA